MPRPCQRAQAREGQGAARRAQSRRRRRRGRGAEDAQLARALRRADQSAGHQPDGRQYVHPDLLVASRWCSPSPRFRTERRRRARCYLLATVLIGSCFLCVQVYEYYQLMVGHHYPAGHQRHRAFPPERQPVRLVLLHDDRLPRGPRHRRCDPALGHLHPVVLLRRLLEYVLRPGRAGRAFTGTSSTWCGSSCSRLFTCFDLSTTGSFGESAAALAPRAWRTKLMADLTKMAPVEIAEEHADRGARSLLEGLGLPCWC